jgi:hypothetical protein
MFHTQVQVCKKLDNLVGEKNQLISKSLPKTVNIISKELRKIEVIIFNINFVFLCKKNNKYLK